MKQSQLNEVLKSRVSLFYLFLELGGWNGFDRHEKAYRGDEDVKFQAYAYKINGNSIISLTYYAITGKIMLDIKKVGSKGKEVVEYSLQLIDTTSLKNVMTWINRTWSSLSITDPGSLQEIEDNLSELRIMYQTTQWKVQFKH